MEVFNSECDAAGSQKMCRGDLHHFAMRCVKAILSPSNECRVSRWAFESELITTGRERGATPRLDDFLIEPKHSVLSK